MGAFIQPTRSEAGQCCHAYQPPPDCFLIYCYLYPNSAGCHHLARPANPDPPSSYTDRYPVAFTLAHTHGNRFVYTNLNSHAHAYPYGYPFPHTYPHSLPHPNTQPDSYTQAGRFFDAAGFEFWLGPGGGNKPNRYR